MEILGRVLGPFDSVNSPHLIATLPQNSPEYAAMAQESLALQRRIEAQDKLPFEEWRRQYLSLEKLRP